jgi:hypothetical protein
MDKKQITLDELRDLLTGIAQKVPGNTLVWFFEENVGNWGGVTDVDIDGKDIVLRNSRY